MPRGGYRENAGRKSLPEDEKKIVCSARLEPWLVRCLDSLKGSRSVEIAKALIKANKFKKPEGE